MDTLLKHIEHWAAEQPQKLAIIQGDQQWTYRDLLNNAEWLQQLMPEVLHTTGSTGKPKAIPITPLMIAADAENLVEAQGFHQHITFITTGPIDHLGSLSKTWATLWVGGTLIMLPGMKDLNAFFEAFSHPLLQDNPKTTFATFLVPAALRMLIRFAPDRLTALSDKIEFIETGAAPMAQVDMEELCRLLPHTRLYNTYASTETGIQCTHDYAHEGCHAGCLGRPMRHAHIEITTDGRIHCTGPCVMGGEFLTNDLGRIDEEGRLWLTGRADDIINVGGYKVSPVEIEEAALRCPGMVECLCRPIPHPVMGQALQLLYVSDSLTPRQIAGFLQPLLEAHKVPTSYQAVEAIPRTPNGKPLRH